MVGELAPHRASTRAMASFRLHPHPSRYVADRIRVQLSRERVLTSSGSDIYEPAGRPTQASC